VVTVISNVIDSEGIPIEVTPGGGNLRRGSIPYAIDMRRGVALVDHHLSFARLFASQPLVAGVVGWFMRQHRRVPLKVYRREGDDGRRHLRPGEHRLATAIDRPWEGGSSIDLVAHLLGSFLIHGNTLTETDSGAREALRFLPIDWRYTTPILAWRDAIGGWNIDTDSPAERRTRGVDTVLHVRDYSPLGPFGLSPLEQLGVTIAIEDAAQRHQRAMLANGVRTASAIQASDDRFFGLGPEERKELMTGLREDVEDTQAGPENAGRPWVLPPGLEVKPVGQTAQEAALIEQRQVSRIEALGVYGLPPYAAGVHERGAELPEQRQIAYTDGLAPPLILIEECINAQLVRGLLHEEDIFVAFDFANLLRGDHLKEIEAIREAVATAVMTPNEGRSELNKPRSPQDGMDDFYLPRNNLWPLSVPYPDKGMGAEATAGDGNAAEPTPAGSTT